MIVVSAQGIAPTAASFVRSKDLCLNNLWSIKRPAIGLSYLFSNTFIFNLQRSGGPHEKSFIGLLNNDSLDGLPPQAVSVSLSPHGPFRSKHPETRPGEPCIVSKVKIILRPSPVWVIGLWLLSKIRSDSFMPSENWDLVHHGIGTYLCQLP